MKNKNTCNEQGMQSLYKRRKYIPTERVQYSLQSDGNSVSLVQPMTLTRSRPCDILLPLQLMAGAGLQSYLPTDRVQYSLQSDGNSVSLVQPMTLTRSRPCDILLPLQFMAGAGLYSSVLMNTGLNLIL